MSYIKHLDGLRALAVILVILFHSGIKIFSGGYIGVDIFFVLSGYLITGIIFKKLQSNSFSFYDFYAKRIKRLIPPVIIIKIFSLVVGYYLMNPYQFFALIDQAFYSTILLSNFYLSNSSDYFSLSAFENPLMHTWSLSLEEQFYLIFPIIFLIIYYKFKSRIVLFLSLFLLISLFMAQFGGNLTFEKPFIEYKLFFFNQPGFASYFMPIGRFFEFLCGSVSYLLTVRLKKIALSHNILSYIGIFIILLSLILYDGNSGFPNLLTLLPVIGTILIIIYYPEKNSFLSFLTFKPFIFIGTISYSLYLWHQPLFAFYRIKFNSEIPILSILIIIFISLIFSYLSHKFIESKIRRLNFNPKKTIYVFFISIFIFVSILFFLKSNNFQEKFKLKFQNKISLKNINLVIDLNENIKRFKNISLTKEFQLSDSLNKEKILILGDSMSVNWIDAINQNKNLFESDYEFKNLILDENCFKFLKNTTYLSKLCASYVKNFQNDLSLNQYDQVFVLLQWSEKSKLTLEYLLDYLNNFDAKVYLVGNAKFDNLQKMAYKIALNSLINNQEMIKEFSKTKDKKYIFYNYEIEKLASKNKINYIDEYDFYCENDLCKLFDSDLNLFFWDDDHLTEYGSKFLGVKLFKLLQSDN